jgi:threonine/homoserine/homoserine lactone efflux protein
MSPNSDLSAGQLTIMAVVIVVLLFAWLIAIFLAAREPRRHDRAAPGRPPGPRRS